MIIGNSLSMIPYINHKNTPIVKKTYISNEISLTLPVLTVLISCGNKEPVVKMPASKPIVFVMLVSKILCSSFYYSPLLLHVFCRKHRNAPACRENWGLLKKLNYFFIDS